MQGLVYNYGASYPEVLRVLNPAGEKQSTSINYLQVLDAQITYAIKEEMAQRLVDVVFRRTELGTAGPPLKGC
jgi:glycerol-3-phosphate dehydrogenase